VLPLLGLIAGLMLGGREGGLWGAGLGFAAASLLSGTAGYALVKARRHR
jgi:hypothetical protein